MYIIATTNVADVYPGCKCVSHGVNARLKPLWMQNVSVISTKSLFFVQIQTLPL